MLSRLAPGGDEDGRWGENKKKLFIFKCQACDIFFKTIYHLQQHQKELNHKGVNGRPKKSKL